MAKNRQPIAKRCKALGISPAVMGYSKKTTIRNPGNGMRRKQSEYATQLKEKQKLKFIYGVLEHQFASFFDMAERQAGMTGEKLLRLLERRLDNVVFRLGFASTRRDARQLVNHGHITVNGKTVDIPSYQVKPGDVIAVKENKKENALFKELPGAKIVMPKWVEFDTENFTGKILDNPKREDIALNINEQLIIELYSK